MTSNFESTTRADWINLAEKYYHHLADTFQTLKSKEWLRYTPYLGWNCREIIAHMTGAITVNFNHLLNLALEGRPVPPSGFNLFLRNANEVKKRSKLSVAEIIKEFQIEQQELMLRFKSLNEDEWLKPAWFFIGNVNVRSLFLVQLSDNIVHERDLLKVNKRWKGFYPEYTEQLVDWFMREFRPASFRQDRAKDLQAVVLYKLYGIGEGQWTMIIEKGQCKVDRGISGKADICIEADTEDLVTASLARTKPLIDRLARWIEWSVPSERREDFVATITGYTALLTGLIKKRIRFSGDGIKMKKLSKAFWHFGQRTKQSEFNILGNFIQTS